MLLFKGVNGYCRRLPLSLYFCCKKKVKLKEKLGQGFFFFKVNS